jgi:beta-1,3-galactosyltransferase 1
MLATMSPAAGQRRRNIIRTTWQSKYDNNAFTMRFVISNPGETWAELVRHENDTYHDMIMLPDLEETSHVANTVKTVEFLTHLVAAAGSSGQKWNYVSKIDDDSFLDTTIFYRDFIRPRLHANTTIIARDMTGMGSKSFRFPGGQFYTLSWDLVVKLADLYTQNPIKDEAEDVLVGRLLHEGGQAWDLVKLDNARAFDYDESVSDASQWAHQITPESVNPHKMKTDEVYLDVAGQMAALKGT